MKIRGHGNGLAIALSAVAVVFAASGTAYAVTATAVNIADPTTPSRVAKVDAAGRLNTAGATATLNITSTVFTSASQNADVYSAPTAATLAVSTFGVVPLSTLSGTWGVYLFQVPVVADGTCSTTSTVRTLGYATLAPDSPAGRDYPVPLAVAPLGVAKYCLDVYVRLQSGTATGAEGFGVQVAGYVVSGKYTGVGAQPTAADPSHSKADAVKGR